MQSLDQNIPTLGSKVLQAGRSVFAAVLNPLVVMVAGVMILFGFILAAENCAGAKHETMRTTATESVTDVGQARHLTLDTSTLDDSQCLVIHNADGKELGRFQLMADESFTFQSNSEDAHRFMLRAFASGKVDFGVQAGHGSLTLVTEPDGSAEIFVNDRGGRSQSVVQIAPE